MTGMENLVADAKQQLAHGDGPEALESLYSIANNIREAVDKSTAFTIVRLFRHVSDELETQIHNMLASLQVMQVKTPEVLTRLENCKYDLASLITFGISAVEQRFIPLHENDKGLHVLFQRLKADLLAQKAALLRVHGGTTEEAKAAETEAREAYEVAHDEGCWWLEPTDTIAAATKINFAIFHQETGNTRAAVDLLMELYEDMSEAVINERTPEVDSKDVEYLCCIMYDLLKQWTSNNAPFDETNLTTKKQEPTTPTPAPTTTPTLDIEEIITNPPAIVVTQLSPPVARSPSGN